MVSRTRSSPSLHSGNDGRHGQSSLKINCDKTQLAGPGTITMPWGTAGK